MSLSFLQNIGLTENEVSVYELLLTIGQVPVAEVIKRLKMKRATAYKVLYGLEEKGLVEQVKEGKKKMFRPESPEKLLVMVDSGLEGMSRVKESLKPILPSLLDSYVFLVKRPVVRVFEGIEGIKQVYEDTLKEAKPIYAVLQTAEVETKVYNWLQNVYVKNRVRMKIPAKVIVASGKWSEEYKKKDRLSCRETVMVSGKKFPFRHEVDIYGDKVAFINYRKGEKLLGVVIKHKQIAETMKAWFDLAWVGAERLVNR